MREGRRHGLPQRVEPGINVRLELLVTERGQVHLKRRLVHEPVDAQVDINACAGDSRRWRRRASCRIRPPAAALQPAALRTRRPWTDGTAALPPVIVAGRWVVHRRPGLRDLRSQDCRGDCVAAASNAARPSLCSQAVSGACCSRRRERVKAMEHRVDPPLAAAGAAGHTLASTAQPTRISWGDRSPAQSRRDARAGPQGRHQDRSNTTDVEDSPIRRWCSRRATRVTSRLIA